MQGTCTVPDLFLYTDPETWKALQRRFAVTDDGLIHDVYQGRVYKEHTDFLSNPLNISLLLNTDGVAIFQSSKVSIWPVWLVINELPIKMR